MRMDREGRRAIAQFLNGLAVAAVSVTILAPLASGTLTPITAFARGLTAAITHLAAVALAERR
jgi:hypothetical protein